MSFENTSDSGSEMPTEHSFHNTQGDNGGFEGVIDNGDTTILAPTDSKATEATWQQLPQGEAAFGTSEMAARGGTETIGSTPGDSGMQDGAAVRLREDGSRQPRETAAEVQGTDRVSESAEAPIVNDATVEVKRRPRLRDRLYHLVATREPATRPSTQDRPEQRNLPPEYDRPDAGRLATEIQRTGGGRFEVSVLEEDGPVVLVGTDGMLPKTGQKQSLEASAGQAPTQQVFKRYARMIRVETSPYKDRQPVNSDAEGVRDGLRIEEIDHEIPNTVIIRPEKLTADQTNKIIAALEMYGNVAGEGGDDSAQATLINKQAMLESTDTPVRVHAIVGAMDDDDLREVVYDIAGRVFPADPTVRYKPATDKNGNIITYSSEEAAMAANREMPVATVDERRNIKTEGVGQYANPHELTNLVRLPDSGREVQGLRHSKMGIFALNGPKLREGALPYNSGTVIDFEGKSQGPLEIDVKERAGHSLTIAGSRWGKTTLINQAIRGSMALKHRMRRERPWVRIPSEVMVDMEKVGTEDMLGRQLAGMEVDGEPLDEDLRTITVVRPPRHDELNKVRPNLNILEPMEGSALDQVAIATRAFAIGITDPEAERVFSKFVNMALTKAYDECGWDMVNGGSKYPGRTPLVPSPSRVMAKLDEVIATSEFDANAKGNLGGFTKTTYAEAIRGRAGQLLQNGYSIDWDAAREFEGIVNYQFGDVDNAISKGAALTITIEGSEAANRRANPPGDLPINTTVRVDEPGQTFDGKTKSGLTNAGKFTIAAGKGGLSFDVYKQGKLEEVDQHVRDNTAHTFVGRTSGIDDEELSKRLGVPVEELRNLKSTERGRGLYLGPGMDNGPLLFQLDNPEKLPLGEPNIIEPHEAGILDMGTDNDFYTVGEWAEATKFLENDEDGNGTLVKGWADMSVVQVLSGRPILGLEGDLKQALTKMSQGDKGRALDKAICESVRVAVEGRPYVMNEMEPYDLAVYVRDRLLEQVRPNAPRPELPPHELRLNLGQLSEIKDYVTGNLTPRALRRSEYKQFGVTIDGNDALQQRDVLRRWVGELITDTTKQMQAIIANSQEGGDPQLVESAIKKAKVHVAKLTAGLNETPEEFLTTSLQAKMNKTLDQMSPEEIAAIKVVTTELPTDAWTAVGYAAAFEKINRHIDQHREHLRPLDLSELKNMLGPGFDFAADTAEEQEKLVLKKEAEIIAASGYKVPISDLLFVKDEAGGYILDKVLRKLTTEGGPKGAIHDEQRTRYGIADGVALLDALDKASDEASIEGVASDWTSKASKQLVYSSQFGGNRFKFSQGGLKAMVEGLAASVHNLKLGRREEQKKKSAETTK